ncbi:MAG: hypothetical protein Q7U54_14395 [Bacteroidales bacterium]|nr:hypothetical protein [Bacteroidales bacterium]
MIKKIILNILLIIVTVIVLDFIIGKTLHHFYFTETSGLHYRTTYSIDSTMADVLVFGSSRANHHYVPEVFEDSLKMSFYNTGRDGNSILYTLAVFNSITNRYTPKVIIIDMMMMELYYNAQSYERLASLLPYYNNHPELQSVVQLRGPFEKYKLLSSIYPFNSSLLTIAVGNLELNKKRKEDNKGYVPLYNGLTDTTRISLDEISLIIDSTNIEALKFICNYSKEKNILLLLVHSPLYAKSKLINTSKIFDKIAKENGAYYLNYMHNQLFVNQPEYFRDQVHLNDEGAKLFSSIITHRIKSGNLVK